jgi:hypothetical protein
LTETRMDYDTFELGRVELQSGQTILDAKLAHKTGHYYVIVCAI